MHEDYDDIRSRISEPPTWFDEHAVPRYCEFSPERCADIYASQACLLLIECQGCGREFRVALSWSDHDPKHALDELIRTVEIHYGDPPNVSCCLSGPSMNSVPRRVLQFWRRTRPEWDRVPELEIEIDPDWVSG
jgi:hypothetical protein